MTKKELLLKWYKLLKDNKKRKQYLDLLDKKLFEIDKNIEFLEFFSKEYENEVEEYNTLSAIRNEVYRVFLETELKLLDLENLMTKD